MASVFTHAFVASVAGKAWSGKKMTARFWLLSVFCSALPDGDAIFHYFRVEYGSFLGHRGITHSLPFALFVSLTVVLSAFREIPRGSKQWWSMVLYFFVVTASHPVLDAMTNGGLGIPFFLPFDDTRMFFPWRPIRSSPIGIRSFFTMRGVEVMSTEIIYVWIPVALVAFMVLWFRKITSSRS
ncbi:MAG: metal-dependent hydrolase [Ignavibacteriae bacterium]|nr:metal-dependent hydrolase [Ignavibacteriota bacterium]